MAAAELLAVTLLMLVAPPLIGFAAFFCGMHSVRHVIRTYHYAGRNSLGFLISAATVPMVLVLLAACAGWMFLDRSSLSRGVTQFLFVGLAALTVPHMVLVERVRLSGGDLVRRRTYCVRRSLASGNRLRQPPARRERVGQQWSAQEQRGLGSQVVEGRMQA